MKKDNWIYKVFLMTFLLAIVFSLLANLLSNGKIILTFIILFLVIIVGIIFDMIGVSALTSKESTFHAKNSKRIKGAKQTLILLKNSEKVSTVCNDVVGDICGIISGTLGATLIIFIAEKTNINMVVVSLVVTSLISALTVGGKAIGKKISVNKADNIIFVIGKIIAIFTPKKDKNKK